MPRTKAPILTIQLHGMVVSSTKKLVEDATAHGFTQWE
jgi:hypothetical protein